MATNEEIIQGINMLKVAYPNYSPEVKPTAQLWIVTLADIPGNLLKNAIIDLICDPGQFAPSLGDIRARATDLIMRSSGLPDAQSAYQEVSNMPAGMSRLLEPREVDGQWIIEMQKFSWSHPFVEIVAHKIGWPRTFPTDEPGVDRAQFIRFYEAEFKTKRENDRQLPAVKMFIEQTRNEKKLPPVNEISVKKLEEK